MYKGPDEIEPRRLARLASEADRVWDDPQKVLDLLDIIFVTDLKMPKQAS